MEILIPEDLKRTVERQKQFTESFILQFKTSLENIVPIGYTLEVTDAKYIKVYKTPIDRENIRWSFNNENLITMYGKSIVIEEHATAVDIYKLCGLLQLLSEVNILLIGNILISK